MLILYAVEQRQSYPAQLTDFLGCFAILCTGQAYLNLHGAVVAGQLKAIMLMTLFFIGTGIPFGEPRGLTTEPCFSLRVTALGLLSYWAVCHTEAGLVSTACVTGDTYLINRSRNAGSLIPKQIGEGPHYLPRMKNTLPRIAEPNAGGGKMWHVLAAN